MTKVVYNACFGGFSLSRAAVLRAREISGDPAWGGPCIKGDTYSEGQPVDHDYGYVKVKRTDPILVQVVEELGSEEASGSCASLAIAEISSGSRYRIDEYDGNERVLDLSIIKINLNLGVLWRVSGHGGSSAVFIMTTDDYRWEEAE